MEKHDCPRVHDHAYYTIRENNVGIRREEYCAADFCRVVVIFNDSTRDALWKGLEKKYNDCRRQFKEMTEEEFWDDFRDIHLVNIGYCLCNTVYYGARWKHQGDK